MLDIFAPQVSQMSRSIEGKSALFYGSNRLGKSHVAAHLPKPLYLAFEAGLNALPGVAFFPIHSWKDYTDIVKQLTDPKNVEKAHEQYTTIVIDQLEALGDACAQYICSKFGVQSLGERKVVNGKPDYTFNGYTELSKENQRWLRQLLLAGYAVVFIGHETTRDVSYEDGTTVTKIYPKGDKRIVDAIVDGVDIIGFVRANGFDADGKEIKSSLILVNSPHALAGSRFDYMPPILKEFSAENVLKAIADAVEAQEQSEGVKATTFAEQSAPFQPKKEEIPFEELQFKIGELAQKLHDQDRMDEYYKIVDEDWGNHADHTVMKATPINREALEMIYSDLLRLGV